VLLRRDQFFVAPSSDGFHAPALHAAPYGSLHPGEGAVDSILEGGGLTLEYHTRKTAQDHFDSARLIDATAGAVYILYANAKTTRWRMRRRRIRVQASLAASLGPMVTTLVLMISPSCIRLDPPRHETARFVFRSRLSTPAC
jgi:hypothetical protein